MGRGAMFRAEMQRQNETDEALDEEQEDDEQEENGADEEDEEEDEKQNEEEQEEDDDEEFWDSHDVKAGVDVVLKAGAVPFCDLAGVLRLRRPQRKEDTRERPAWPVRSRHTAAWVAKLFHDKGREPLTPRQMDEVILILEGRALDSEMPFELEDMMEREPALAMIVAFMATRKLWRGTASELLPKLQEQAALEGMDVKQVKRWPKSGSQLSVGLGNFTEWFTHAGIEYKFKRTNSRRMHTLRQTGDATVVTASPVSSPSPSPAKPLPPQ